MTEFNITLAEIVKLFNEKLEERNKTIIKLQEGLDKYKEAYKTAHENGENYRRAYFKLHDLLGEDEIDTIELKDQYGNVVGVLLGKGPTLLDSLEIQKENEKLKKENEEYRQALS